MTPPGKMLFCAVQQVGDRAGVFASGGVWEPKAKIGLTLTLKNVQQRLKSTPKKWRTIKILFNDRKGKLMKLKQKEFEWN